VQLLRGDARAAKRRWECEPVPARLGGREFPVRYHTSADVERAMSPWFGLRRRVGIGVFVPPSAAEPWISEHPTLVRMLEAMDRVASVGGWGVGSSRLRDTAAFRACSPSPLTRHFPPRARRSSRSSSSMMAAPHLHHCFRTEYADGRDGESKAVIDARGAA
jgi:hypothetical protein